MSHACRSSSIPRPRARRGCQQTRCQCPFAASDDGGARVDEHLVDTPWARHPGGVHYAYRVPDWRLAAWLRQGFRNEYQDLDF